MSNEVIPIILNPAAGRGRAVLWVDELRSCLKQLNLRAKIMISVNENHLCQLTRKLSLEEELIVGAGGDSTFHLMANEIVGSGSQASLGFIALGSSNDVPLEFGFTDIEKSLLAIKKGQKRLIDMAALIHEGQIIRYVLGQVNIGLGVAVNQFVASLGSRWPFLQDWQELAGLLGIINAYKNKKYKLDLSISTNNADYHGLFTIALFTNIRFWATGRKMAPAALPDDGQFDLCLIQACPLSFLLRLAQATKKGQSIKSSLIIFDQSNYFRVNSDQKFVLQADGEIIKIGGQPFRLNSLEIKVIPRCLKLVV